MQANLKLRIAGEVKNFNPLDYFEKKKFVNTICLLNMPWQRVNRRFNNRNCNLTMTEAQRAKLV
jgi:hypothetical protein